MELQENEINPQRPGGKASIFIFLLLVLVTVGLAVFVYLKSQDIDPKTIQVKELLKTAFSLSRQTYSSQKVGEMIYDGKDWLAFSAYRNMIIKVSREGITAFNENGEEQWNVPVAISNPLVKTAGNYLLLADAGGKDFYVVEGKDIKWSKKTDSTIVNADISESGHVTVLKDVIGYKGAVTVFNLQGNEFFTRGMAERYPVSAKVSPTGKQVVINSVDASGVKVGACLEISDMLGKPAADKFLKDNAVFPSVWYLKDGSIAAVGEAGMVLLDKNGKEKWSKDFPGMRVCSSRTALDKYVVLAVNNEPKPGILNSGTTEIKVLGGNGEQISSYPIDGEVKNMDTFGDMAAVSTGKAIYFINIKGRLVGRYTTKTDILKLYFLNKQEAFAVTKNSVDIIKVY